MQESYLLISEKEIQNIHHELSEIKKLLQTTNNSSTPALKDWVSQKEAMDLLGLKYTSLYKLRRDKKLISTSTRPIFYSLTSINEYLNSMK